MNKIPDKIIQRSYKTFMIINNSKTRFIPLNKVNYNQQMKMRSLVKPYPYPPIKNNKVNLNSKLRI